jgi:hypothetical protein
MIYCFDLDGTLCTHDHAGRYLQATPIRERIAVLRKLKAEGHTIIIDTARGSVSGEDWQGRTAKQLADWGVPYDELRTGRKVFADAYIDDKGMSADQFFGGHHAND